MDTPRLLHIVNRCSLLICSPFLKSFISLSAHSDLVHLVNITHPPGKNHFISMFFIVPTIPLALNKCFLVGVCIVNRMQCTKHVNHTVQGDSKEQIKGYGLL
ncbi:UNVERIFIED_CONTAM: hypothetical protein K2H54_003406 [Gekko kuhli]